MRSLVLATSLFVSTLAAGPVFAQATPVAPAAAMQSSENDATRAVDAFMAALSDGRLEAARQAMTPEAVVIANGTVLGTRDGYIDGAAKGDAVAMKSVRSRDLLHRDSEVGAQLAWVVSEKRMVGEGAGQFRAMVVIETILLKKTASGWKISGIHWSSRNAA
ncbi:nuclear transport factor 2 family protein [Lysobacter sp. KIS68-7]|uniref:nuclear transport factor 2 family protein n=1 Tax=Lysobacter sp. KIS68-7 TaxID=2904252 RepID=UPI001E3A4CAA|nr:nuclear transport factor 2 family protein [Lysobacter sp. KIS68-7]UHQ19093.1 nuclear transport factor 2 family protein [Lysobacter sp. KIS68-7]